MNLTKCGSNVFYGCSGLQTLNLDCGLAAISYGMFKNCTSLTNVTVPKQISTIESNAFAGCSSLTKLTLENAAVYLGGESFHECTALSDVIVSGCSSTHSLGNGIDETCISLKQIVVSEGTEKIANGMFKGMSNLENQVPTKRLLP